MVCSLKFIQIKIDKIENTSYDTTVDPDTGEILEK